ncbi:hypothetical protein L207DRAFT_526419 [Hyaloscypha variabilis F]|uniref:2EXR domain-containing protein n=1 Tax=Hyaloscypha variabilis (strain UAMH 11265 / GT02V1 / F) TaxID=1149755 RepID=A0A2J6RXI1_HYAVF|nr:hypothetical protein L207DRAFT_526419 [Hyaloscypha variabilis F]
MPPARDKDFVVSRRFKAIDTSNDNLYLLQNELPDLKQELYRPTFHFFSQLPLELRLMIWQRALPGPRGIWTFAKTHNHPAQARFPKPPNISSINRESRSETLKHYQIFEDVRIIKRFDICGAELLGPGSGCNGSILWNRQTDFMRGDWDTLWYSTEGMTTFFSRYLLYSKDDFFGCVSILELKMQFWDAHFLPKSAGKVPALARRNWLQDLTMLSEVRLINDSRRAEGGDDWLQAKFSKINVEACIDKLTAYFEGLVASDPTRTVPRIVLYEPLEVLERSAFS